MVEASWTAAMGCTVRAHLACPSMCIVCAGGTLVKWMTFGGGEKGECACAWDKVWYNACACLGKAGSMLWEWAEIPAQGWGEDRARVGMV